MPLSVKHFGFPFRLGGRSGAGPLTIDDKMAILWALAHQWSIKRIAKELPAGSSTIEKFKHSLIVDPTQIVNLPVYYVDTKGRYRCRFCGATRPGRIRVIRHVMSHILPRDIAENYPIGDVKSDLL